MSAAISTSDVPLLQVRDLSVAFVRSAGVFGRSRETLLAVDGVTFHVQRGETFGLVGESGSGKTTVARAILNLVRPTAGQILFKGVDLLTLPRGEMRKARRYMQMVFQDPKSTLNPRMTVKEIVAEPLVINGLLRGQALLRRVIELLQLVGLDEDHLYRLPHELSGGQRQRVSIARALSLEPELLILDEPTSALDVSVQALILELLLDLQQRLSLTYLVITHDMSVIRYMSDRVAVMWRGKIVETSPTDQIFAAPQHEYTRGLFEAMVSL